MGIVDLPFGEAVIVTDMVEALAVSKGLKLAMAVGDTHGANVVALGQEEFQRHAPIPHQPFGVGPDLHPFSHFRRAGGQEFGNSGDFYQAEPARAHIINSFQMAESRDGDSSVRGSLQNRRAFIGTDLLPIDG